MHSNSSKSKSGNGAKNWFDSDDDVDDTKSLHSSETTLAGRDEKGNETRLQTEQPFCPTRITTDVSAGADEVPSWTQGVTVTRQVLVETSLR